MMPDPTFSLSKYHCLPQESIPAEFYRRQLEVVCNNATLALFIMDERQFIETYDPPPGYSDEFKRECLKLYVNGMGFRAIERVKGVHHTTIITWVKQIGELLPDAYQPDHVPEVGELDELETFVGSKKQDLAVDCG